jgi:hypothetical protein
MPNNPRITRVHLGTHPFVPGPFKLGDPAPCRRCPNDAAHAVHDWLSPITPEEMVQLPNLLTAEGGR